MIIELMVFIFVTMWGSAKLVGSLSTIAPDIS